MPKLISKETKRLIIDAAKEQPQVRVAEIFKVSRVYVNRIVNNKPLTRTRPSKNVCPITGVRL